MTILTSNLGLTTYNGITDGSTLFANYVSDVSGSNATQNLAKIDAFAGRVSGSLTGLSASIVEVSASIVSLQSQIVPIGTPEQITAGSSNGIVVSASALAHSDYGKRAVCLPLNTTGSLLGTETNYVRIPPIMNNWILIDATASVSASCISGSPTFGVYRVSASSPDSTAVTMLTSNIYIKGAKYDSSTSGCTVVISTTGSKVLTGDRVKVAALTSASPATFSEVSLVFQNLP